MKSLNYVIDHILYQIFKMTLKISLKNETVTDNPLIIMYVHAIENRITSKIKTRYYPELLTAEQLQMSMVRKYLKEDIYLQKRTRNYWWFNIKIIV